MRGQRQYILALITLFKGEFGMASLVQEHRRPLWSASDLLSTRK